MEQIVLVVHLVLAVALVATVLMQRSEGGGLGMGGGGGSSGGGIMSGRAAASALTRVTGFLAAAFMCTSLFLAVLASGDRSSGSILDSVPSGGVEAPAESLPVIPTEPVVPAAE